MNTYLTIMVTVLVLTQVVRITQNMISLRRNNELIKNQIAGLQEITNQDIDRQRTAYDLTIRYMKMKLAEYDDGR